jgi:hypothetical protein
MAFFILSENAFLFPWLPKISSGLMHEPNAQAAYISEKAIAQQVNLIYVFWSNPERKKQVYLCTR